MYVCMTAVIYYKIPFHSSTRTYTYSGNNICLVIVTTYIITVCVFSVVLTVKKVQGQSEAESVCSYNQKL